MPFVVAETLLDKLGAFVMKWNSFNHGRAGTPSVRVDRVAGSETMYFIFGGILGGVGLPPFEFVRAASMLSDTRVFIRDLKQSWYQAGLVGISNDIEGTRQYIESLIAEVSPERVVMIGGSMGGFAAILFSGLVGNSRAIVFSPQTFISPCLKLRHCDYRWRSRILLTYWRGCSRTRVWDLAKLRPRAGWRVDIHVSRLDRLDCVHARHLGHMPGVHVVEYDHGGHGLVRSLRDSGQLSGILNGGLAG